MSSLSSDLKRFNFRCSNIHFSALSSLAHSSNLSLNHFLLEKGLSAGLSFDPQLRLFIQRVAFESFLIREELPNFAKSILALNKLLSLEHGKFCDVDYKVDIAHRLDVADLVDKANEANEVNGATSNCSSNPHNPSSSNSPSSTNSVKLQQLLHQLPLLFDKLAFSTEFLITLFGNIKLYPDVLRNLHFICERNPHILSASLNFDFSPSSTSNTPKTSNLSHSFYRTYSHLPNFAFLTFAPYHWAFSSASQLKNKAFGSGLVNCKAYSLSSGHPCHPYSLYSQ
ncbi:MAG: hypothetical protein WAQ98_09680 [Blastocatellia bacterium]